MCWVARGSTVGARQPSAVHVAIEFLIGFVRHRLDRHATLGRARVDLVVNVGDVAHVSDVVGAIDMAQQPEQHVEDDDRPRVADMGEVVDRRPAHIHAHVVPIDRHKRPLLARQRIVELELHSEDNPRPRWPGVLSSSQGRKDGRSQRWALANNLAANAADVVKAVHWAGECSVFVRSVKPTALNASASRQCTPSLGDTVNRDLRFYAYFAGVSGAGAPQSALEPNGRSPCFL